MSNRKGQNKYGFADLTVGESVTLERPSWLAAQMFAHRVRQSALHHARVTGKRFSTRKHRKSETITVERIA
jgi:hypothetical protein